MNEMKYLIEPSFENSERMQSNRTMWRFFIEEEKIQLLRSFVLPSSVSGGICELAGL